MSKTNFDKYLEEQLKDPKFTRGFEAAGRELDLAKQLFDRRMKLGLSQAELAAKVGTTQQQISRLEQASYRGSIRTLERVAEALGVVLEVRLTEFAKATGPQGAVPTSAPTKSGGFAKRSKGVKLVAKD